MIITGFTIFMNIMVIDTSLDLKTLQSEISKVAPEIDFSELNATLDSLGGSLVNGSLKIVAVGMLGLYASWIFLESAKGFKSITRADNKDKLILSESGSSIFSSSALRRYLFGLPLITMFISNSSRVLIQVWFLVAAFFLSLAFMITTLGVPSLPNLLDILLIFSFPLPLIMLLLICFVLLPGLFTYLSNVVLDKARSKVRFSVAELIRTDQRSPILFLRAFRDDQVLLSAPNYSMLGKLFAMGMKPLTLDHIILEEGTVIGPVIALGNPRDKVPPYGVARGYYDGASWQRAVADLAESAAHIVICIDETDSIWWEVDYIVRQKFTAKTLFLFHPKYQGGPANGRIMCSLLERLQLTLTGANSEVSLMDKIGDASALGFFIDASNTIQCGVSSTFSREAYFAMLRWFLRKRAGEVNRTDLAEAVGVD